MQPMPLARQARWAMSLPTNLEQLRTPSRLYEHQSQKK